MLRRPARRLPCRRRHRQGPGFEERIGTRWVVWIAGSRSRSRILPGAYSIEAGLLGPGVRTILGGLFALALLWRRMDTAPAEHRRHRGAPIANIPAILTAAAPRWRLRPSTPLMRCMISSRPPPPSFCWDWCARHAGGGPAAWPALQARVAAAFVTPVLGHPSSPTTGRSTSISRSSPPRLRAGAGAAVALACDHHHRLCAALDLPVPDCGPPMIAPHLFHVIADSSLLRWCGDGLRVRTGRGH